VVEGGWCGDEDLARWKQIRWNVPRSCSLEWTLESQTKWCPLLLSTSNRRKQLGTKATGNRMHTADVRFSNRSGTDEIQAIDSSITRSPQNTMERTPRTVYQSLDCTPPRDCPSEFSANSGTVLVNANQQGAAVCNASFHTCREPNMGVPSLWEIF